MSSKSCFSWKLSLSIIFSRRMPTYVIVQTTKSHSLGVEIAEAYLKLWQIYAKVLFLKIVDMFQSLTVIVKSFLLDVRRLWIRPWIALLLRKNLWLMITFSSLSFESFFSVYRSVFCLYGFSTIFAFTVTVKVSIL